MQPRSKKILGIVLPVLFVGFLLVIASSWSSRQPETRTEPLEVIGTIDDPAELISYEFEDTYLEGDRMVSRVQARRTIGFESGWYQLEDAFLTFFRPGGGSYTLEAPRAELNAKTKEARAEGGVQVASSDGLELSTAAIRFDGHRLSNDIPIEFSMNEWAGKANGVDLNIDENVVNLMGGLELTLQTAEGPVMMEAKRGVFRRDSAETELFDGVAVKRERDTSWADVVLVRMDQSHSTLTGLEGKGNVTLRLSSDSRVPGQATTAIDGEKTIEAESFRVVLNGSGEVRQIVVGSAQGTPVRATLEGVTTRSLSSDTMTVDMNRGQISEIEASGSARVIERGSGQRMIESDRVNINIEPATGRARMILFDGGVRLTDAQTRAFASRALFKVAEDLVTLTTESGSAPSIESGAHSVRAEVIELLPSKNILRARGRVVASISSTEKTALFDESNEPIFVNSNTMVVRQEDDYAAFSGNVRVWQSGNTLFANEVQLLEGGATVLAKGDVRAVLNETGGTNAPETVKAWAGQLRVTRGDNRIELEEDVRVTQTGRTLAADRAIVSLGQGNKVERVVASGAIKVTEKATGRSASGDDAVYDVKTETIVVEGSPATVKDENGSLEGKRINFDLANNRVRVERGDSPTEATYNADAKKQDSSQK